MTKPVRKLIKHPGLWRVDGYSNLETYSNSAPRVFISLSQITEDGQHSPLRLGQTTGEQLWLKQPLSRISDLLIGSCWRGGKEGEGKRINRLPAMEKTFVVDTSKIKIVSLDEQVELNCVVYDSVLPSMAIKLQKNLYRLKHALYAVVPVLHDPQTKFLVVSCYELYRAYLGVSDRFMNNIVHNNLGKYMEWNNPKLKVKTRLSRLEQFVAYRGHYNQEGCDWFNMPSNHLKKLRLDNRVMHEDKQQPLVIKSTFPFSGRTILTVAGKRFKNVKNEHSVWCVFAANLLHCSKDVDFEPIIESDIFSNNPLPWQDDVGDVPPQNDDPFDDEEDIDETEEQPNAKGRKVAILGSSNFFGAMHGLNFNHVHTGESTDPVYENNLGDDIDSLSRDELGPKSEDGTSILQENNFDSHVNNVNRKLSDFITMVIALRGLVKKHNWTVTTRSCGSAITVEGEVVTTFLDPKSKRRTWPIINDGTDTRLRQIAWVEIAINDEQFIYLTEMELKESEKGRSTLCIVNRELKYMSEDDFKMFLGMTSVQNKWPKSKHPWKTEKAKNAATSYFESYVHFRFSHPTSLTQANTPGNSILTSWAKDIEIELLKLLGMSTN
ncbi:hypothetical protein K5N86_004199 [Vibrio parahaemolyticus]|nr:hypothetical protein [Vibrio parahaemolyticus]